ncbi:MULTISPECIES: MFS transporter [Pseudomonas]|uniref:MFS transporter n=1 Tax=Pseudomonas nitroreducens TaxID=46680 RepID=A0ABS0KSP3_PSENT|nr:MULTISPECIES: MFS transporter [Pseudomonas]MBG6291023.1 MFS transporter [Pseudomonas nitroreducens]MCJ1878025.1 MFS transporter [Pseudomonas nitroreducens]MCJ1894422.1 MFS transporter [Pseudomonas nitroreducens]MDG9858327.1 MFS transporter [Pseudomonas nitroreducens]MDH1074230.1 MFS transporter [Pseudomonas nitroreducens]
MNRRNGVLILLMLVMVISVLDKTIFAFAGAQIIDELKLSPTEFGFVGSAFFFLYSISGVLVGFLANRFPTRWILAGMSVVWMASQLVVALSSGFAALVAGRLLLGAGTGPGTAVTQHACFKWFGPKERVLPSALIQVSIMLGAVLGALSLPLAIQHFGWRTAYFLLALLGLVWLVVWLIFGREGQQTEQEGPGASLRLPYSRLLLNRSFLWITLMGFLSYLPTALVYSWVPVYLQKGQGMTPMQSGYTVMVVTVGVILANLLLSTLSQRAMQRGTSVQRAMVLPPMAFAAVAGIAFCALTLLHGDRLAILVLYALGAILVNVLPTFCNTLVAYIAPSSQRGSMLAIHIGGMTSAGMLAPWIVGQLVELRGGDIAHGFETALGLFGVLTVVCAILGCRIIAPERTRQSLQGGHSEAPLPGAVGHA